MTVTSSFPIAATVSSDSLQSGNSSELEKENDQDAILTWGRPGEISPSSVCRQRRLSAAIVTNSDSHHEYLKGRPTVVVPPSTMRIPSFDNDCVPLRREHARRATSEPIETAPKYRSDPPPMRLQAWSEPPAHIYRVRSRSYLQDQQKLPSQPSAFRLLTVDLVQSHRAILEGLCSHPEERIQKALEREKLSGTRELPKFIFAVNLCVPGPPFFHMVAYFGIDDLDVITSQDTPLGRLAYPFFFGDSDEYRNNTFKLIPRIVEGNFVVRKAVGTKPALLGRKLQHHYIRTDRFMEVVVDIGSDKVAEKIVRLSIGYARSLVVDMMFLLEGHDEETLPEHILGGVRMCHVDFKKRDGKRRCCPL